MRGNQLLSRLAIVVLAVTGPVCLLAAPSEKDKAPPPEVVLAADGQAKLPIIVGSKDAGQDLQHYLKKITGADFTLLDKPGEQPAGIYVGLAGDFPSLKIDLPDDLGPEGFVLKTDGTTVLLLAGNSLGVRHAVSTLLHKLGCRWFFPGKAWEVVPHQATLALRLDEQQSPSYSMGRHIHYGFGAYPPCEADFQEWNRRNRMGGPVPVGSGHSWFGLSHTGKDFKDHPEWFALVNGTRKNSKPCYSHPDVIKQAIRHALDQAAAGVGMISMTPPDGLGYCECERCMAVCKGGEPFKKHGTTFAKRLDGVLINVASETVFECVNQVAAAVAEKYPRVKVGCYAYSAYSHPPSFKLHPNVFIQVTTAYRRTDLTLPEQLEAFRDRGCQSGLREYFSVYQWDWDVKPPQGKLAPAKIKTAFTRYHELGVRSINAEASNNWGPRGLSYYLIAQVMWDTHADVDALLRDFFDKAFGPAAEPMKRWYHHWYGAGLGAEEGAADETGEKKEELVKAEQLKQLFLDLDDAALKARDRPDCLARVDLLRMYVHYLVLRQQTTLAGKTKNRQAIIDAVQQETIFGAHLAYTNMIHTRAMVGKAFDRRFKAFDSILKEVPESQSAGKGWRTLGPAPSHEELEKLWTVDKVTLQVKEPAPKGPPEK